MRKFLNCLFIGFIVAVGWPWVHGLCVHPPPMTLAGVGQTFQSIDGRYALFSLGFCALVGTIFGIFLKGEPGAGTRAFYSWNAAWDALPLWR